MKATTVRKRVKDICDGNELRSNDVEFCIYGLGQFFDLDEKKLPYVVTNDQRPRGEGYYEVRVNPKDDHMVQWRQPHGKRWTDAPFMLFHTREQLNLLADSPGEKVKYIWLELA